VIHVARIDNPDQFVGRDAELAKAQITENGYEAVVIRNDKWSRTPLKDYDPLRIRLSISKGIVTKAEIG
jgi:hypothetical protein